MENYENPFDDDIVDWFGIPNKTRTTEHVEVDMSDVFGDCVTVKEGETFSFDDIFKIDSKKTSGLDQFLNSISNPGELTLEQEIDALKNQKNEKDDKTKKIINRIMPSISVPIAAPEEYEEADYGDAYDDYLPSKLRIGIKHPDAVVESSSLSVVQPPDVSYKLAIPSETIENGWLSSLQLESIVYACQKHQMILPDKSRAGYLIGDGPGVGKGRIISGIIFENMLRKRTKALWISVSNDLRFDANRDLEDIGCEVFVYPLNKISYNDQIEEFFEEYNDVGVLFSTYSSLIGECHSPDAAYRTRLEQILDWLTPSFDGVIVFDECHKAKNLMPSGSSKPTKTASTVLLLQQKLPSARVVYCSATGASEPRNMAYMVRLGLWGIGTPFNDFEAFLGSVEKRGVGGMELVAIDMKQRGVYLARQLSFTGVNFAVREIALKPEFKKVYDESVVWWDMAFEYFERAADIVGISARDKSFTMAQFFSSHQRFFKTLCIASKVDEVVSIIKNALANNMAVVIGLQSTGESKMIQLIESQSRASIVSTAYGILLHLMERNFPTAKLMEEKSKKRAQNNFNNSDSDSSSPEDQSPPLKRKIPMSKDSLFDDFSKTPSNSFLSSPGLNINRFDFKSLTPYNAQNQKSASTLNIEKCKDMENQLMNEIKKLSTRLPPNTLDELIDKLGGPDNVAEMTGRKSRIVRVGDKFICQSRHTDDTPIEMINVKERDDFMDGAKFVAIISEAASSGISLQADKRATNKRKRLHITLELSWSADRVIQQFGRTHRSNQLFPPEYLFVISELAGEKRFACVVAKRLESLGALTHGDRRASESRDFSQFNIDNKYGRYALERMLDIFKGKTTPIVDLPKYPGDFLVDAENIVSRMFNIDNVRASSDQKDKENVKIHKFLNRLLGVKVDLQNAIYQFYTALLDHFVKEAKKEGKYDFGIIDFGRTNENVQEISHQTFNIKTSSGITSVELYAINIERGIKFEEAAALLDGVSSEEGFYMSRDLRGRFKQCMLVLKSRSDPTMYTCSRPNTGFSVKKESLDSILKNYYHVSSAAVMEDWNRFYNNIYSTCSHMYFFGNCKTLSKFGQCDVGKRVRTIHLLCGAIFSLWHILETTFGSSPIRMARITTVDSKRRIGIVVPLPLVDRLVFNLNKVQTN